MTKDEWIKRFVTRMIDRAGRDHFDDGELILDYAYETAPSYWEDGGSVRRYVSGAVPVPGPVAAAVECWLSVHRSK